MCNCAVRAVEISILCEYNRSTYTAQYVIFSIDRWFERRHIIYYIKLTEKPWHRGEMVEIGEAELPIGKLYRAGFMKPVK